MSIRALTTADGSLTCEHPDYRESYHAREGARSEALAKFILPGRLADRLARGPVRILDIGFGLGMNARVALETAQSVPQARLQIDSLEADPLALERALALYPDCALLQHLAAYGACNFAGIQVHLHMGDARVRILTRPGPYDLIFHDPFSPMKNTECWTVEFFQTLRQRLHPDGMLLTYAQARAVRAGLLQAGFSIGEPPAAPPHRPGTLAVPAPQPAPYPIDPAPFLSPPHNIAYHDPQLRDDPKSIRARRETAVRNWKSTSEKGCPPSDILQNTPHT